MRTTADHVAVVDAAIVLAARYVDVVAQIERAHVVRAAVDVVGAREHEARVSSDESVQ